MGGAIGSIYCFQFHCLILFHFDLLYLPKKGEDEETLCDAHGVIQFSYVNLRKISARRKTGLGGLVGLVGGQYPPPHTSAELPNPPPPRPILMPPVCYEGIWQTLHKKYINHLILKSETCYWHYWT